MNARHTSPTLVIDPPAGAAPDYCIGARWRPGHIERRDSETGFFEVVNSRMDNQVELDVQRALLSPVRSAWKARRIAMAQKATHAIERTNR